MNIGSLWAYRFCVSWLCPPEATGAVGFPDLMGIEGLGHEISATGGSGGRSPPAAGGHGSERLALGWKKNRFWLGKHRKKGVCLEDSSSSPTRNTPGLLDQKNESQPAGSQILQCPYFPHPGSPHVHRSLSPLSIQASLAGGLVCGIELFFSEGLRFRTAEKEAKYKSELCVASQKRLQNVTQ